MPKHQCSYFACSLSLSLPRGGGFASWLRKFRQRSKFAGPALSHLIQNWYKIQPTFKIPFSPRPPLPHLIPGTQLWSPPQSPRPDWKTLTLKKQRKQKKHLFCSFGPFSFSTLFSLASLQLGWTVACGLFLQVSIFIGGGGFGGDDDDADDEDDDGVDGGDDLFASLLLLAFFSPSLNSHSLFIPTWSNISWIWPKDSRHKKIKPLGTF